MSFREITMQDVSEVLHRYQAGQSARHIARETGLDRKTVGRYLAEAKDKGVLPDTIVSEQLRAWLCGDKPLRLVRVHELLGESEITYSTLLRYVQRELGWRKKTPTIRLDDPPPGLEAQIGNCA